MTISNPHVSQIPALRALWKEAFADTDEFLDLFFRKAFYPGRCRCIFNNTQIVAALYWFDCQYENQPIAYIYAVATAKSYRGQGLCQKLLTDTHHYLTALGYSGALLVPGNETLFSLYHKMGYNICSTIKQFECNATLEELPFYKIASFEYAKLRKELLPKRSVLQENENLDFLQTQMNFYMGPGFLLAAHGENNTLYGAELLGDISIAPAITHSLGYTKGIFRTAGSGKPFAMYYPLGNNALAPPSYFAFAFD